MAPPLTRRAWASEHTGAGRGRAWTTFRSPSAISAARMSRTRTPGWCGRPSPGRSRRSGGSRG